jgi:large repetitive protein
MKDTATTDGVSMRGYSINIIGSIPPVTNADTGTTFMNTAILLPVLSNDTDADTGAVLSVTGITVPANATATASGSQILFTPNIGWCGATSFQYRALDELGASGSLATVSMTVTCNAPPVANNDSLTLSEDTGATLLNIIANDTDYNTGNVVSISGIVLSPTK